MAEHQQEACRAVQVHQFQVVLKALVRDQQPPQDQQLAQAAVHQSAIVLPAVHQLPDRMLVLQPQQAAVKAPTAVQAPQRAAAVSRKPHKAATVLHALVPNTYVHRVSRATADHRQQVVQGHQVLPTLAAANQVQAAAVQAQATTEAALHHQEVHRQASATAVRAAAVQVADSQAEATQVVEAIQAAAVVLAAVAEEDNSTTNFI